MVRPGEDRGLAWRPWARAGGAVLAIVAVAATVHGLVNPYNFTGWDEWLYLDLVSRGLVSFPHSNRPLALLFVLPAAWLSPGSFLGFHWLHLAYTAGTGVVTWAFARRLVPGDLLPLAAGTIAAVWAPADDLRLATVLTSVAAGVAFGASAALVLFAASWRLGRQVLLWASGALAFVVVRSYEPTVVLLAGAPLAMILIPPARPGRGRTWLLVFGGWIAVAAMLAAVRPGDARPGELYQDAAVLDPNPPAVVSRLAGQFDALVRPAFLPGAIRTAPPVLAAPLLFLIAAITLGWFRSDGSESTPRPGRVLAAGIAWTTLGLLPFCLSPVFRPGSRSQFLCALGVGITCAALLGLATRRFARPSRVALIAACAGWLVLVGAARTATMQDAWSREGAWPRQSALLSRLRQVCPDLRPGTLLILLDRTGAFDSTFAFRHAIRLRYGGHAIGWVASAAVGDLFYPTVVRGDGIHVDVWPMHQRAWGEKPQVFQPRETVVVFADAAGHVSLVERWPANVLGPLPAGADYAPAERIVDVVPSTPAYW